MKDNSLNKLAWKRFRANKLSFSAFLVIIVCVFLSFFSVLITPDKTPMANDMHIELATLKPLTKVTFLCIPKNEVLSRSILYQLFIGKELDYQKIPISSYVDLGDKVQFQVFNSLQKRQYTGDFHLKEQIYWFGTDKYGRDFLSRIIYGMRISLSVGFIAVFISLLIGIGLGLTAGYFRGKVDYLIMWFVNVIWSIPTLLMVIAITLALGKGFWQVFIAVGMTMWVDVARIVRGQVLTIRELEYIEAGKVLAYKPFRIIFHHILPNIVGPVIVIAAANFATAILIESGLSFLGIGAQPPIPSWGTIIKDHYAYIIMNKAYLAIIPGLSIMVLVLSFMLLGNGLRDAFDVKAEKDN